MAMCNNVRVDHLKFSFPHAFSAKTLWVPAHWNISPENFVGARAPRTRRSAPHGYKSGKSQRTTIEPLKTKIRMSFNFAKRLETCHARAHYYANIIRRKLRMLCKFMSNFANLYLKTYQKMIPRMKHILNPNYVVNNLFRKKICIRKLYNLTTMQIDCIYC